MNGSFTTVSGNLTRDPEVRVTKGGTSVCSLGIASNRRWKKDDEWEEEVTFYKVECWGDLADHVGDLEKGNAVIAFGTLSLSEWETDEGDLRVDLVMRADDVGVSLKWQTVADVDRPQRNNDDSGGRGGRKSRNSGGGKSRNSGRGRGGSRSAETNAGYDASEEPF